MATVLIQLCSMNRIFSVTSKHNYFLETRYSITDAKLTIWIEVGKVA